ncbi:hypothetical protein B0T14DRAFT_384529, partial [Immersiella caudata]
NPLVAGGQYKGDRPPKAFITHTMPCIHENTIIVATTHPSLHAASPKHDGWFISDFYAFNYLFKSTVKDQTWLTAVDPSRLLEKYGNYLHGHPRFDRKVILNQEILQSEITPVTIVKPAKMIERFLDEVAEASSRAKQNGCPLLLMFFCHGVDNHHLLLNDYDNKSGLSITQLRGVLDSGIAVTLFSTSCFSGGWATTRDLNITTMAAADEDTASVSWRLSDSMGRACGSVFAGHTIASLTKITTPLLPQDFGSEGPLADKDEDDSLQPSEPTEVQTETYNEFCRAVVTAIDTNTDWHSALLTQFTFSAQDDQWEYSWSRRSGLPLARFKERWDQLPVYPATSPMARTEDIFFAGGAVIDEMTCHLLHARVRSMASLFYNICDPDWVKGQNIRLGGAIHCYLRGEPAHYSEAEIAGIIRFRWMTSRLMDRFIDDHGLTAPNGQICILWNTEEYELAMRKKHGTREWSGRYSSVWKGLLRGDGLIRPSDDQGPPFYRSLQYVTSAIAENSFAEGEDKANAAVEAYCNFVATLRKHHIASAMDSATVRTSARSWLKAVGRRIR